MAIDPAAMTAAQAYQAAAKSVLPGGLSEGDMPSLQEAEGGETFAGVLKGALMEAREVAFKGETTSLAAAAGQAELNDVVTAMAEAEVTLRTVTTVRDRVIEAYKEILRMPV